MSLKTISAKPLKEKEKHQKLTKTTAHTQTFPKTPRTNVQSNRIQCETKCFVNVLYTSIGLVASRQQHQAIQQQNKIHSRKTNRKSKTTAARQQDNMQGTTASSTQTKWRNISRLGTAFGSLGSLCVCVLLKKKFNKTGGTICEVSVFSFNVRLIWNLEQFLSWFCGLVTRTLCGRQQWGRHRTKHGMNMPILGQ